LLDQVMVRLITETDKMRSDTRPGADTEYHKAVWGQNTSGEAHGGVASVGELTAKRWLANEAERRSDNQSLENLS